VTDNVPTTTAPSRRAVAGLEPERLPEVPQRQIRVGWVAGPRTFDWFGQMLRPQAIGMLGELVRVLAVCPAHVDAAPIPSPPFEVLRYPQVRLWRLRAPGVMEALMERLRPHAPQILHALDGAAAPLTAQLARRLDVPYLVSAFSRRDGRFLRRCPQAPGAVLAASRPIQIELRRRRRTDSRRLHLLRPGVHKVRHANCFNDPRNSISLVTCGPLDDRRAYGALVRSFAELLGREEDCMLFIMGSGPAERHLRRLAERLGVAERVSFPMEIPARQMPGILKAADVYLSPVPRRYLDVPCLLAMAAGVPVLSAGGGVNDFLQTDKTTQTFRPGDARRLSELLSGLLEDRPAARELAEGALAHIAGHHSPAASAAGLAKIYREVLRSG
jgi:glycosyltransferase involved in cell wall biosynthesis